MHGGPFSLSLLLSLDPLILNRFFYSFAAVPFFSWCQAVGHMGGGGRAVCHQTPSIGGSFPRQPGVQTVRNVGSGGDGSFSTGPLGTHVSDDAKRKRNMWREERESEGTCAGNNLESLCLVPSGYWTREEAECLV